MTTNGFSRRKTAAATTFSRQQKRLASIFLKYHSSNKFDARMQAQLEGYLVAVGILQKGQTLSAQELPPEADAVSSSSAFED